MINLIHCEICNELYKPDQDREDLVCPSCRGMSNRDEVPEYIKDLVETLKES